jgi:hydrogenase expression/formation protein HypC
MPSVSGVTPLDTILVPKDALSLSDIPASLAIATTTDPQAGGFAMCLGIPGQIVRIVDQQGMRMGDVDFGGVIRRVCLAYVPEARVGDYTVVHAGFAISKIDPEEAASTLEVIAQLEELPDKDGER